jgi:uncharacterized damage-inducible protein DinB
MTEELIYIFERDLDQLSQEMEAFRDEAAMWETTGAITNSAGNLCLHLAGNLNHYMGAKLGKTGYERDRPAEFNRKDVPRSELLRQVDQTKGMVATIIGRIEESRLDEQFPEELFGHPMTIGFFLLHLHGHLSYHLGQINYLRRALEG